ncbi:MAG: hypothetical protein ACRD0A_13075 [Acidimicrobiales bacterium]
MPSLGGMVLSLLFGDGFRIRPSGVIGSIGAVIVLAIWGAIRGRSSAGRAGR